jgi:hypothetical protein
LALTVVTLGLIAFVAVFRLIPPRNVTILFAVFGLLIIGQASLWALRSFWAQSGQGFRDIRLMVTSVLYFLCLLGGVVGFSKKGEAQDRVETGNQPFAGTGRRIEEINQTLLDVFRL